MATLTSRLVISLTDRASGPARNIGRALKAMTTQAYSRPLQTLHDDSRRATQSFNRFAGSATAAGFGLWGFITATREFNESKFGYGMSNVPEYLKEGKFHASELKLEMESAATAARKLGRDLGIGSSVAMKALEETVKLGFKDDEKDSIWRAALGLSMADKDLASGESAKFLGAMWRAYEKQRNDFANKIGKDPADKAFIDAWIRGIAAKAGVAAADSALGPVELIEGLRQYAPQWAQLGMSPEFAMAMLAHGSNYGFRAPELGTAFKSMANKAIKPTAEGLRWLNSLGIKRDSYMNTDAQDPLRATNQLNSLLGGGLGVKDKRVVRDMLDDALRAGTTASPEFQEELTQRVVKMLGRKTEADVAEIQMAVANASLSSGGQVDLNSLIKQLIAKKAGPAALMSIFEGRHFARGTPTFAFYDKMYSLFERLQGIDARSLDAIVELRKGSEAGTADALFGAFNDLLLAFQETGVIEGVKNGLIGITDALRAMPTWLVKNVAELFVLGTALTVLGGGLVFASRAAKLLATGVIAFSRFFGIAAALRGVATGIGTVVGMLLSLAGVLPKGPIVGPSLLNPATGAAAGAAAAGIGSRVLGVGRAIALGAGRFLIPGLGIVTAATMGYGAYQGYKQSGSLLGGLMGAFGMGPASAAEAGAGGGAQAPAQAANDAMAEVKRIIAATDLTSEGERLMHSLAAGIRSGAHAVGRAVSEAVGAQVRAAVREAYSDGGLR
ncbi:phage tail tape measure protein [Leptospira interrogans]